MKVRMLAKARRRGTTYVKWNEQGEKMVKDGRTDGLGTGKEYNDRKAQE